ncbi:MAG: methyltransferase domain-containing protein [Elusimicrobiales bacterium]|nr:methyltransferase domain-containing protein [Elusimicrobiales bacterium]
MQEASKTKLYFGVLEKKLFQGNGIDIGCGNDPVLPGVDCFDVKDGDANDICKYVNKQYDFVFSSHCLEHMKNPFHAIHQWWKLVKDRGYLYIVVPDEDLYEHGNFPSKYNDDHKWTFSLLKQKGANIRSANLIELFSSLEDARILKIEVQDNNYDYELEDTDQTLGDAAAQICFCIQKNKKYKNMDYKFENHFLQKIILLVNTVFINFFAIFLIFFRKIKKVILKK